MIRKMFLSALLLVSLNAFAGSTVSNVTISMIGYDKGIPDVVFIKTSMLPSTQTRISCHTDTNWNYVLRLSIPLEEKMYAALLAAQASRQNVILFGSGLCNSSYPLIESLQTMYVGS